MPGAFIRMFRALSFSDTNPYDENSSMTEIKSS
jgi:hypothetical protein